MNKYPVLSQFYGKKISKDFIYKNLAEDCQFRNEKVFYDIFKEMSDPIMISEKSIRQAIRILSRYYNENGIYNPNLSTETFNDAVQEQIIIDLVHILRRYNSMRYNINMIKDIRNIVLSTLKVTLMIFLKRHIKYVFKKVFVRF